MPVTEITHQSWGSRIGGSIKGILVGLMMVAGAGWLLFWNEGRAVKRYKALKEGAGSVISVPANSVAPGNEGRLVHLSGRTETANILTDRDFGVSAEGIHLKRQVEMYQWVERTEKSTKKKLGGGTETKTTYSYDQDWADRVIDSSNFKDPSGHRNPDSMPYSSRTESADLVTVGAFRLSPGLISRLSSWQALPMKSTGLLPPALQERSNLRDGILYLGSSSSSPQVGDVRISFAVVPLTDVSLAAQQVGNSLAPYQTRTGSVELLQTGTVSAADMFQKAQEANKTLTRILRIAGFLIMVVGFRTIFKPLSVLADVLPALGNLAEKGLGAFAFALAALISLVIIAVAWLVYRPLLAFAILCLAAAAAVAVLRMVKKARLRAEASPPPPPPPLPPIPTAS
ncbi:MAG: TMEM43 family protein [Deltaproteobacteria bacterium]|nr:TMEM43 family protein [Deltaproteobacteria bacterium]